MTPIARKFFFPFLSIFIGFLLSVALVALVEFFFKLNKSYKWIEQPPEKSFGNNDLKYLPPDLDVSYYKNLKPYEAAPDYSEPDNYEDTYKFKDCLEPRLQLKPYWFGSPNCNARMIMKKRKTG